MCKYKSKLDWTAADYIIAVGYVVVLLGVFAWSVSLVMEGVIK